MKHVPPTAVIRAATLAGPAMLALAVLMLTAEASASDVPAAPSNLEWKSVGFGFPQLNWNDNSNDEDGFRLYQLTASGREAVAEYPANSTFGATPDFTFEEWCDYIQLVLVAFNETGESADSNIVELPPPPSGCKDSFVMVIYNYSGHSAGRMLMEVAGVEHASVVGNAPGCPSPSVSGFPVGSQGNIEVSWQVGCVDPLHGLSLRLEVIGPSYIGAPRWIPELRNGDVNCSGAVDATDALAIIRDSAGFDYAHPDECPAFDEVVPIADANCDGVNDSADALSILRSIAGFYVSQNEPCPEVGDIV